MARATGSLFFPDGIRVIDSHTAGEPTRVVIEGWPALRGHDMAARSDDLRSRFDHLRSAVVGEPRAFDAVVGALLTEPATPEADAGVIFFNNVGCLGMCGHGTIGVVRTLQYLGRVSTGRVVLDTPAGTVAATLEDDGVVTIRNVPAVVHALDVTVEVAGVGAVTGDVAWGGNWFFIARVPEVELQPDNLEQLLLVTKAIRRALGASGVTAAGGATIDHVELAGPPLGDGSGARCFVLCPGGEYDRSPCGTGTSAKMAVLHARGMLRPGERWRQESITGGVFEGWVEATPDGVIPFIRGRAHITGETVLRFESDDPFRAGLGWRA